MVHILRFGSWLSPSRAAGGPAARRSPSFLRVRDPNGPNHGAKLSSVNNLSRNHI
jgi:hypothetical protein